MPYSLDLRKKVIDYVERGGGVTKASQIFQVSRASIYRWLNRENLEATKVKRRQRKLNWEALKQDVKENPQQRLIDRAIEFNVQPSAILYALRQMKITRKKNNAAPLGQIVVETTGCEAPLIEKETELKELNIIEDSEN